MKDSQNIDQMEVWNKYILEGNESDLSRIYAENFDLLYNYGKRITASDHLIEDAIQEVFISIIKYRKSIGYVKNVKGYLVSTFRRQLFLDLEKSRKLVFSEQFPEHYFDYFVNSDQEKTDQEYMEELHATIAQCVEKLTDKQREILFLRFESEICYEDIAQILNISVESCYKSIYRSVKSIRGAAEKIIGKSDGLFGYKGNKHIRFKSS